jgi:phosphate-selective porin OprO/OprP
MNVPTQAPRLARTAFLALLMTSVATGALAAPKHQRAKASPNAALAAEVKELRAQIEELKAAVAAQAAAQAQPVAQVEAQQAQIETLGQQVAEIKTNQAAATSDIATLKKPSGSTVVPKLSNGKPAFATADGAFSAELKAVLMFDAAKYMQKNRLPAAVTARDLNDGTTFRRARLGLGGKLFKDFDYGFLYEFGGSGAEEPGRIHEAYLQYNGLKPLRIRLGAFEPNIGLAAASSTSGVALMERPAPAEIARGVAAGDARSALQVAASGVVGEGDTELSTKWLVSTALTGAQVGAANAFGEQQAWIGRVALAPSLNGFQAHLGANVQHVFHPTDATGGTNPRYPVQLRDRPELRVDGARLVDTGAIDTRHITVYGAEAGLNVRNFTAEGEYFKFNIDRRNTTAVALGDPRFDGWYVQGSWVITGEPRTYNGGEARFDAPKPAFNFNPKAGVWGAFELAARYSTVNLNWRDGLRGAATPAGGVRGGEQTIWTVGLNWYLNPSMRMMFNYQNVEIDRLNATGVQIGQKYDAVAMRAQLAF